jgi:hypothetical protein
VKATGTTRICLQLQYRSGCHYIVRITTNKPVSAAEANRRFSEDNRAAEGARCALFARLSRERVVNAGRWTRDELYDDAP